MGGDDSQKLLPWRGIYFPSGAQTSGSNYEINNVTETAVGISWVPPPLASLALASATARLGHFWKAQAGQFCRAPKSLASSRGRRGVPGENSDFESLNRGWRLDPERR